MISLYAATRTVCKASYKHIQSVIINTVRIYCKKLAICIIITLMLERYKAHPKRYIAIVLGLIAVVALVFLVLDLLKSSKINILVAPGDSAIVTINGEHFENGSYRSFPKGRATIKIEAPGFKTKEYELDIKANATTLIHDFLEPEDGNYTVYDKNKQDYKIIELTGTSEAALKYLEQSQRRQNIVDYLPISKVVKLSISEANKTKQLYHETVLSDASTDEACKAVVCLFLSDNFGEEETARQLLKEKGFNYDDYQIIKK